MLVWACIAPHGGELIPELADGNLHRMKITRGGMEELQRRCFLALPDTIVLFTPHGLDVEGHVCISMTDFAEGELAGARGSRVAARFAVDRELAGRIGFRAAERGVPVVEAAYTRAGEPAPSITLDWGALVPLWFMGARWPRPPHVVLVCPSRSLSRRHLLFFGQAVAEAAIESADRVAIICSADQGHGHAADGPYGFAPMCASYDRAYCQAVRQDALARLLHWREDWIEAALPDSYWQTLILHGALKHTTMRPTLISYEAPT